MRKLMRKLIVGAALTVALMTLGPAAGADPCGGCFCSAGSGSSGGYACVSSGGYNRWLPFA